MLRENSDGWIKNSNNCIDSYWYTEGRQGKIGVKGWWNGLLCEYVILAVLGAAVAPGGVRGL